MFKLNICLISIWRRSELYYVDVEKVVLKIVQLSKKKIYTFVCLKRWK